MAEKVVLGIDFGGSGIKGAPVDIKRGKLLAERHRIPTPENSTPQNVADVINDLIKFFKWKGPVGVGFPAVSLNGVIKTASNISKEWIGVDAKKFFTQLTGCNVFVVNDADAAGYAEMKFGEGKNHSGTVLLVTIGTGVGSVLFSGKKLVANTELGQIFLKNGLIAEKYMADSVRQNDKLDWKEWGERFNEYLLELEKIFWPELIIVGGGISKREEFYGKYIHISTPLVMAKLRNEAGIIGAALAAHKMGK